MKLAQKEAKGPTAIYWRDGDLITIGTEKLTEAEFEDYIAKEFSDNSQIIVLGWDISEVELPNKQTEIMLEPRGKKYVRK